MKIIVMSRQIGSFGDKIGALAAEHLDFQLIGPDQVHELAERCDPSLKDACALYEKEVPKNYWELYFLDEPSYVSLFESLNYELAGRGNVILMGRGSQILFHPFRGILKIRIVAPFDIRVRRVMESRGMKLSAAEDFVKKIDHRRRMLIEHIYHQDVSDWQLYDIVLNTAEMTPEDGAYILTQAAEKMPPMKEAETFTRKMMQLSLAKRVESAIRKVVKAPYYTSLTVDSPREGALTLSGAVVSRRDKEEAERIARSFDGVAEVANEMQTSVFYT